MRAATLQPEQHTSRIHRWSWSAKLNPFFGLFYILSLRAYIPPNAAAAPAKVCFLVRLIGSVRRGTSNFDAFQAAIMIRSYKQNQPLSLMRRSTDSHTWHPAVGTEQLLDMDAAGRLQYDSGNVVL